MMKTMIVQRIDTLSELVLHKETWNELAGAIPHLRFEWMVTWWRFFGDQQQLLVLCIRDHDDNICGYAPWYIDTQRGQGDTICFLGSGKACGDHLSLLCSPEHAKSVAATVAAYLMDVADDWQHLELIGGDADDVPLMHLCQQLVARDLLVHRRAGLACYVIQMPASWEEYLSSRSKTTRRKLRRQIEKCTSADFEIAICQDRASVSGHWSDLVRLHQKRRGDLGTEGCFDDTTFGDFLHAAAVELTDANLTELSVLKYLGQPAAAELCFVSDTTTYYYQSGMDPDLEDQYPGLMLLAFTAKRSADRGTKALDMLRGEEPYKIRWHGKRVETVEIRAASTAWQARLRQQAWQAGAALKDWLKSTAFVAPPTPQD